MPVPTLSLAAIRHPAFLYDAGARIVEANDIAEAIAGQALAGTGVGEILRLFDHRHPDGTPFDPAEMPVCSALAGTEVVNLPFTVTTLGGARLHVLGTASPVREDGAVTGALVIWHDVTAIERLAGALSEGEAKYRNLVELSPDAILIHQDGQIAFANQAAAALVGADGPADLEGRPVLEIVASDRRATVEWNITADLRGEESPLTRVEVVRRDGTTVTVQGRGARIPFRGRPAVQVILRDITAEQRAADALAESEERLRLAKNLAQIGIWESTLPADGDGELPRLLRIYDDDRPDTWDYEWRRTVHPDDLTEVEEGTRAALALGEPVELEFRFDNGEGRTGWLRLLGGGVYDEAGRPVKMVGVYMDVTDRKEAEAALRESECRNAFLVALGDRLRELGTIDEITAAASEMLGHQLEAGGVAYCEVDAAGETATVRAHWPDGALLAGTGPFSLDSLGVGDLFRRQQMIRERMVPPSAMKRVAAMYRSLGVTGLLALPVVRGGRLTAVIVVYTASPRDWTEADVDLVRETADRVWNAVARARAEEALRRRERTLQGIFRAAPVGIGMASDRIIIQANDQICRMTGYTREELVGQDARMLYPDEEAYAYVGREKYAQIMAEGTGAVETRWRTRDGAVLDILLSSSPLDMGRPYDDVVFIALDITRLRESERAIGVYLDELQRSNEELQRFAYVASHDLQEPLRSIISFSQLLERRYRGKLGEDADDYIGFIVEGGNRMQRLIEDLLQLSRVETRARPLEPTDAGEVLEGVLRLMGTPIREAGATVEVGPMPTVMADAAQLAQVFSNLISNAIKYRRPDVAPVIRVSAEREDRLWRFAVADNGIGIEEEYFDRIFVIFQRLHTRDEYEGTGIGLAVVRKIVERHGGRIGVRSTPGEGSTFFFSLPVA